jgi:hypothetical protein
MKLTKNEAMQHDDGRRQHRQSRGWRVAMMAILLALTAARAVLAAAVTTTTVQGTVYLADGSVGSGTLYVSWPAFTTSDGLAVVAGHVTATIGSDGFVSLNLAPNAGATPAGLFYTAVYTMSDGTTSTEYWVVPSAAQAAISAIRAQVMPAAQAVQAVTKEYVDALIANLSLGSLSQAGGTLVGPLYLSEDPTQPMEASDKHYVDTSVAKAVPIAGGNMTGALTTPAVNGVVSPTNVSAVTTLQSAVTAAGTTGAVMIPPSYTGTDTFTNATGVRVEDFRLSGAQQHERSVKEFGAVCDGSTDDTSALQTALNYAFANGVALTLPQGTCKTQTLTWRGESIRGLGKAVSALKGFPGQDVLASATDSTQFVSGTELRDLTIDVDVSVDVSCASANGRASAGSCAVSRVIESGSVFSSGGSGLTNTTGTGAGWYVGNCAIAMPASTGAGGNGLKTASMEDVRILATGTDPLAASYSGARSTHTCGLYLAQWPKWSVFRNLDIEGVATGVALPALSSTPSGLVADGNRWEQIKIKAAHGFTAAAGSKNAVEDLAVEASNSSATAEAPTGLVLDLTSAQKDWTARGVEIAPSWIAVQPSLAVTTSGGAVTAIAVGSEEGLGFDPYGTTVPVAFSSGCTASATAAVNSDGSIGSVTVSAGGTGCSSTTTASVNAAGTWDTAAAVNLIGGAHQMFFGGNLLEGAGGYTVWNAVDSQSHGTQLAGGGGGNLPGGGSYAALVGTQPTGSVLEVDQFAGADFGAKLLACVNAVNASYGGTCDARNFAGAQTMAASVTISAANTTVLLPCATITTAQQIVIPAGMRNVTLRGCSLRGTSAAGGLAGGTVFAYTGASALVQVGDATYATNTMGFHLDDVTINTTNASSSAAQGLVAYRTQEMNLESLYLLGNANQTGMTLDGTGNYTGGTFADVNFNGFQTAVNAIGHQVTNSATTDWLNASTFVRLHVDCPTSNGSPIAGTYGINLQAGDGNTFMGGDVEGCATALHLGASAKNNTIVGLRNENSTSQVVADAGSAYNNWMTGGTMFTGALTDNGTRNSFLDTFHRSFNGMNGDWYGSQQDATVTNHFRLGIGSGNERGLLNRYQTDYGYRWTEGLSDATAGEQFYQILDELNGVYRLSIGQYNNGQTSTNNQTVINSAGTGAVVLNGSASAGTGGVIFGSGGASETTVATVDSAGDAAFNGTLKVGGATTLVSSATVRNSADAEIDATLWAGATANQKEAFVYKDYTGASQWYMVKDASNNWALNSAVGGLDSIKAYQSTNSGDTYINAAKAAGAVRVNYETGAGTAFNVYGGSSSSLYASFAGTGAIKFPGLSASSGHNCLQIDSSGYITNTGSGCGTNTTTGTTLGSSTSGYIAYYTGDGTSIGGMATVPLTAGGTGATTASAGLANLSGVSTALTTTQTMAGSLALPAVTPVLSPQIDLRAYGATIDGATDIKTALVNALAAANASTSASATVLLPCQGGCYLSDGTVLTNSSSKIIKLLLQGTLKLGTTFVPPDGVEIVGDGGGGTQSFQGVGAAATIQAPTAYGALGTAVTTLNSLVSFMPTFTSGSIANMPAGAAITIAGSTSCTINSIARVSGVVTATLASSCRIPAGTTVTVAGVTDTSFVATPMIARADYPALTLTWAQTGTDGTSSGGTVTGFNEDSFETVRIQSVSGSTATAVFYRTHTASDQWGVVAIAPPENTYGHHHFENLTVSNNYGAGFWAEHIAMFDLRNVGIAEVAYPASVPVELDSSWWYTMENVSLLPKFVHGCGSSCGTTGYPYGLHCSNLGTYINSSGDGGCGLGSVRGESTIGGGVKFDSNGLSIAMGGPTLTNVVVEQPVASAVMIDPRYGWLELPVVLDNVFLQDNFWSYPNSYVGYTDVGGSGFGGEVDLRNFSGAETATIANNYYSGRILLNGINGRETPVLPTGRSVPVGAIDDGKVRIEEIDGMGAGMGPSLVPVATQAITTDPGSWTCTSCTLTTGVAAPDGTTTAATITPGSTGYGYITGIGGTTGSTSAGDWFLAGAWVRGYAGFQLWSYGASDSFAGVQANTSCALGTGRCADANAFMPQVSGLWWHPVVMAAKLTTGTSTSHNVNLVLNNATSYGNSGSIWMPFLIRIPASAGMTTDEVERIRQQLLHGVVPPGMPAGGGILAMHANHKLYWGSDTDLYRSAAGVVRTDGALDAANGYLCNGSYGSSGQQLTSTGSGCKWSSASGVSNASASTNVSTSGTVLSTSSDSSGNVTIALSATSANTVLAGPSAGTTTATPSFRALVVADLPAIGESQVTNLVSDLAAKQSALTNPVTGPGSGATAGDLAVFGNAAGTAIVDGGAVPTLASLGGVSSTTTVNGHALSSNVTVSAGDLTAGALPSGTTATTQAAGDSSTNVATDAFVASAVAAGTYDFTTSSAPSGLGCSGSSGSYSCTAFPAGNHMCTLYVIGGGAGGGSGAACSTTSTCYGGGGGAGSATARITIPCSMLGGGTTVTVAVGAGGAGGAAQSASSSSGSAGTAGGCSSVVGASGYMRVSPCGSGGAANSGSGGSTSSGAGGTAMSISSTAICTGAAGGSGAGGAASCYVVNAGPQGGAGGGGLVSSTTAAGGAQTSTNTTSVFLFGPSSQAYSSVAGGTAGGGSGSTPAPQTTAQVTNGYFLSALGGSGGGSNCTGAGGAGGVGMSPGGGGGGGGAACNGYASGAGGKGGDGFVRIVIQ